MTAASKAPAVERIEKRTPAEVLHWYWVTEEQMWAESNGIETPAICGAWDVTDWAGDPDGKLPLEAVLDPQPNDCPACLSVLGDVALA